MTEITRLEDRTTLTREEQIMRYLLNLGFKPQNLGFKYTIEAIQLAHKNDTTQGITTLIYPAIAKEFNVTASQVERAIRHSIFRSKVKMRTNKEFLSLALIDIYKGGNNDN